MTLLALQRDFRSWLQRADRGAAERIAPGKDAGFGIYQNNYRAQLAGCLEGSFPMTRTWIGATAFHEAIVRHVEEVPPSSWTLDLYPLNFPQTLDRCFPDDPEIAELAKLELALEQAFVAPDEQPVGPDDLAAVDWDHAVLRFTSSLQVHEFRTNAAAIWSALADEQPPPAAKREVLESSVLLVWRSGFNSRFRTTDRQEARLIANARAGCRFNNLCELIDGDDAVRALVAGRLLGNWISSSLITGIECLAPRLQRSPTLEERGY